MKRGRPKKDIMKAKPIDHSQPIKTEGGMAHSLSQKEDIWGGKKPPFPRSDLMAKTRSGLALRND